MFYWLHLLNSPLSELSSIISILWWISLLKKIPSHIQFLSVTALKKEQASYKQSSWQMPLRIMLLFLSHSQGFFGSSLSFCPEDVLIFCFWLLILSLKGRKHQKVTTELKLKSEPLTLLQELFIFFSGIGHI